MPDQVNKPILSGDTQTMTGVKTSAPQKPSLVQYKKNYYDNKVNDLEPGVVGLTIVTQLTAKANVYGYNAGHLWKRLNYDASSVEILDLRQKVTCATHRSWKDSEQFVNAAYLSLSSKKNDLETWKQNVNTSESQKALATLATKGHPHGPLSDRSKSVRRGGVYVSAVRHQLKSLS